MFLDGMKAHRPGSVDAVVSLKPNGLITLLVYRANSKPLEMDFTPGQADELGFVLQTAAKRQLHNDVFDAG